eukprot:TRINITY_DN12304_c0_g1_i1.p1 TRINITY_DN12304_c0_g1~~TRINITY_DN12304_c0_g1_i1.p1  ORF type:complete len:418 (+),score=88.92 TRINITY_DN12304_c0_g1_i1:2-1255(+)
MRRARGAGAPGCAGAAALPAPLAVGYTTIPAGPAREALERIDWEGPDARVSRTEEAICTQRIEDPRDTHSGWYHVHRQHFSNDHTSGGLAHARYLLESIDIRRPHTILRTTYAEYIAYLFSVTFLARQVTVADGLLMLPVLAWVWVCQYFDIHLTYIPSLYSSLAVFPLAFAVVLAYNRREQLASFIEEFRAVCDSSVLLMRNICMRSDQCPVALVRYLVLVRLAMHACRSMVVAPSDVEKRLEARRFYRKYNQLKWVVVGARLSGCDPLHALRLDLVLNQLAVVFERIRAINEYRSPLLLTAFFRGILLYVCVSLPPYVAYLLNSENSGNLNFKEGYFNIFLIALSLPFMMMLLFGTYRALENPVGSSADELFVDGLLGGCSSWTGVGHPCSPAQDIDDLIGVRRPIPPFSRRRRE